VKVAVVGGGIAGMAAAWHAAEQAHVTLFEAENRLGGHTDTLSLLQSGRTYSLDSGFTIFNDENYPGFSAWLDALGVPTQPADTSFSVRNLRSGLEYGSSGFNAVFCQRRNLASVRFWGMLTDLLRFYREVERLDLGALTLAELIERRDYGRAFVLDHLVPLCSTVWALPSAQVLELPAAHVVQFMARHQMLQVGGRPQWRVVRGGAHRYVGEFVRRFRGDVCCGCRVERVERRPDGRVQVTHERGSETFDALVLACHSDQALRMLADPSPAEREVLGAIRYHPVRVVVHSDSQVMPRRRRAWCTWNVLVGDDCQVSYWVNRLQSLSGAQDFFVTLNPTGELGKVWGERTHEHPVFDSSARAAQARRQEISGVANTYYCGAYWGLGSHEDAFATGVDVAIRLGSARSLAA